MAFKTDLLLFKETVAGSEMELWRERLVVAHKQYEDAAQALEKALATAVGVAEARARMLSARSEYLRRLRMFSDLALGSRRHADGEPPPTPGTDPPSNS
jgi:hypothetical protein